jgi:phosphoribosylglycinamide formyltransferase 1
VRGSSVGSRRERRTNRAWSFILRDLYNLVVDLDERFASNNRFALPGVEIDASVVADDRTLAWIDETFGGAWSSEAHAGTNVIARDAGAPIGFATFDPKGLRFAWLRGLARERDVGVFGPFGVAPSHRDCGLGDHLLHTALAGLRERGYARALIAAVGGDRLVRYYAERVGARVAERFEPQGLATPLARTVVMASGNGSNLQAVIDAVRDNDLPLQITALITNNEAAYAIERAHRAGIPQHVLTWNRKEHTRAGYDAWLREIVALEKPQLVLLLGWMHLLDEHFVRAFPETINLHPAFLPLDPEDDDVGMPDGTRIPAFRGARAVRDALAGGSRWTGATVHVVTPATDRGPVVVRKPLPVEPGEDEAHVMERLHPIEHRLVVAAVKRRLYEADWFA